MRVVHAAREDDAARGVPVVLIAVHAAQDERALDVREADEVLDRRPDADAAAVAAALPRRPRTRSGSARASVADPAAVADGCAAAGITVIGASGEARRRADGRRGAGARTAGSRCTSSGDGDGASACRSGSWISSWATTPAPLLSESGGVHARIAPPRARRRRRAGRGRLRSRRPRGGDRGRRREQPAVVAVSPGLVPESRRRRDDDGAGSRAPAGRRSGGARPARRRPAGTPIQAALRADVPGAAAGRLALLRLPTGPFVRVDAGVAEGDAMRAGDPLLASITAWGTGRAEALARLRRALAETLVVVEGGATNLGLLLALAGHPAVLAGELAAG